MELVWPAREYLPSYLDALNRGWSPDNVRGDFNRLKELHKIDADADGFLAGLVDREAKAGCGIGSWGGQCLSLGDYVTGTRATSGAPPAGGC